MLNSFWEILYSFFLTFGYPVWFLLYQYLFFISSSSIPLLFRNLLQNYHLHRSLHYLLKYRDPQSHHYNILQSLRKRPITLPKLFICHRRRSQEAQLLILAMALSFIVCHLDVSWLSARLLTHLITVPHCLTVLAHVQNLLTSIFLPQLHSDWVCYRTGLNYLLFLYQEETNLYVIITPFRKLIKYITK